LGADALLTSASVGTTELLRYSIVISGSLMRSTAGVFPLTETADSFPRWARHSSPGRWQLGGGGMLCYQCARPNYRFAFGYGTVFNGPRESYEGERSVGLRVQFHFGKR
jgi:hypothetical protein